MVSQDIASRRAASRSGRVTKNRDIVRTGQARRLNELLLRKDMTQADLMRATGLPAYAISRAVRGENVMGETMVEAIARALEVEPSEIVDIEARGILNDLPAGVHCSNLGDSRHWLRVNMYTTGEVHLIVQALLSRTEEMTPRHLARVLMTLEEMAAEDRGNAQKDPRRSRRGEVMGTAIKQPEVHFVKKSV